MKKASVVFTVVAVVAAMLAASPASAIVSDASSLGNGNYKATYSDYSDLYWAPGTVPTVGGDQDGMTAGSNGLAIDLNSSTASFAYFATAAANAVAHGANTPGTLENRTIFNVSTIQSASSSQTFWTAGGQQLSGMLYNLTLIGASVSGNTITLDFGNDTKSSPLTGPGLGNLPAVNTGGVLQVYASPTTTFGSGSTAPDPLNSGTFTPNATPKTPAVWDATSQINHGTGTWGPAQWVAGSGATSDSYPGIVNGGSLWLSAELLPFSYVGETPGTSAPAADVLYEETINLTSGVVGSGTGYADVVGGSFYSDIYRDIAAPNGTLVDLSLGSIEYPVIDNPSTGDLSSFGSYSGSGFWPTTSQDPVDFDVLVPEPCTLSLLGFGLAGLFLRRRK